MLCVVRSHARRRQNHFDRGRHGVRVTRQVVGIRFHDQARVAFFQIRRLALAGIERQRLRRLIPAPDQPV